MKTHKLLCAGLAAALLAPAASANTRLNVLGGRVAIVCDGNSPDPDDLAGVSFSLALMKSAGQAFRVNHLSYNCHLQWERHPVVRNSSSKKDFIRTKRMPRLLESIETTMQKWGGYSNLTYQNGQWKGGTNDRGHTAANNLRARMDSASYRNKLYVMHQGEPDIIYTALSRMTKRWKRAHVIIISHGDPNDTGDNHDMSDILRDFPDVTRIKLPDQNNKLRTDNLNPWRWARDSNRDKIRYLYNRLQYVSNETNIVTFLDGKGDCSDAGLVAYYLTRIREVSPTQMKDLIQGDF